MNGTKDFECKKLEIQQRDLIFHCKIKLDKHVVKKNSRVIMYNYRTKKPFLGKSKQLAEAEKFLTDELRHLWVCARMHEPIDFPIWCCFLFHVDRKDYYTKEGRRKKTLGDLSNFIPLVEDCLESAGIIENDFLIESLDWSRILPSHETSLEIYILNYCDTPIDKEDPVWDKLYKAIH